MRHTDLDPADKLSILIAKKNKRLKEIAQIDQEMFLTIKNELQRNEVENKHAAPDQERDIVRVRKPRYASLFESKATGLKQSEQKKFHNAEKTESEVENLLFRSGRELVDAVCKKIGLSDDKSLDSTTKSMRDDKNFDSSAFRK